MARVMVVRPEYDPPTIVTCRWADSTVADIIGRHELQDFRGPAANRANVQAALDQWRPECILFYGHGADHELVGQFGEPLIELSNVQLLRDAVVHAVCCWSANLLGPAAIQAGARAYIGYTAEFWVVKGDPNADANGWIGKAVGSANRVLLGTPPGSCNLAVASAVEVFEQGRRMYFKEWTDGDQPAFAKTLAFVRNRNHLRLLAKEGEPFVMV